MSRLVVDASVVVKWFLPEVLAAAALRLAETENAFLAPELLAAEFASALWKKQRREEIEAPAAARILADFRPGHDRPRPADAAPAERLRHSPRRRPQRA